MVSWVCQVGCLVSVAYLVWCGKAAYFNVGLIGPSYVCFCVWVFLYWVRYMYLFIMVREDDLFLMFAKWFRSYLFCSVWFL